MLSAKMPLTVLKALLTSAPWAVQQLNRTVPIYFSIVKASSGLYYKLVTIVNDDSSVISKLSFKLIVNPRVIIYDCHRFTIQATGRKKP